ncbi:LysR family transcriptional regulator [Mesorhizobium sp.]|uniref:LysR family transcriptional regulator n=1 Tax=Mesorhizobium sp. TaxID=1871066 RepID=UPI000FE75011|nr:LysR family transcriptional regulator [Mesorhizobium sp.]RWI72224.1 MAG: LysR family transcriptional regulator [Mesorhizobium sp.]
MHEIDLARLDLNLLVTFEVLMTEGSVTRAAQRLGRTQSAVSHALGRLREQLGDPLLVKIGSGMAPSPFAQSLIEDVRPILRSIQRIVSPPEAFDPATSRRVFRVAIADFAPTLLPRVISDVQRQAPGVSVEWLAPTANTMSAVADGQVDVTLVTSSAVVPEGVQRSDAGNLHSVTFARKGHPAIASWGGEAWSRWPHIQVQLGERGRSDVQRAIDEHGMKRTIGASVPNFSQVPALLAQTNLIATMTPLVMDGAMERFGLRALEPPLHITPTSFSFVWSFRLANDPGSRWFRTLVMEAYKELEEDVAWISSGRNLVKARERRPR